jgi:hypothetical protein
MADDSQVLNFRKIEYAPDWLKAWRTHLVQIELSLDNEKYFFPDFDNIFSRSESVKEWWFLLPENKGCSIYQSDEDIDFFWNSIQRIYNSSILQKVSLERHMNLLLGFETTSNFVVDSLLREMVTIVDHTDSDNSHFSICYYYNFFAI